MIKLLILVLAAFRLTVLVTQDDFPPIKWLRDEWAIFHPKWRGFLTCSHCVGFHTAWLVYVLYLFGQTQWIVDIVAIAGALVIVVDLWKKIRG